MTALRIACIGEVMIELGQLDLVAGQARVGFAGDTFNTAVYLSRLMPGAVSYVTNLGTDSFSGQIMLRLANEGISAGLVGRHDSRLPGIYAIEVDGRGERSFRYWREASAARTLFGGDCGADLAALAGFDVICLSGITLAILPPAVRAALIAALARLRGQGRQIVFDSNYRPRLWPDAGTARAAFAVMWAATTIALPSFDDEDRLYPGTTPDRVLDRIAAAGVAEVVLKDGARGAAIRHAGRDLRPALSPATAVVDTTGAGDSFNAGYLAARLSGQDPASAATAGHALALTVIAHHGAIIARDAMPRAG